MQAGPNNPPKVKAKAAAKPERFTLRQVVELSGLSEFTLRGWESRYSALAPRRTGTGRRLYSRADVQKALALKSLTESGHKISEVASLPLAKLELMVGAAKSAEAKEQLVEEAWPEAAALFALAERHLWGELETALHDCLRKLHPLDAQKRVLLPLLGFLSRGVGEGRISVAQEHILSALVREQLVLLRARLPRSPEPKGQLLLATPEGDTHDLGLLVAHNFAVAAGFQVLYLGPNTPKKELCEAAVRWLPTHVLVASTVSEREGAKESLLYFLSYLDRHLPASARVWLGGRNVPLVAPRLARDCRVLRSLEALEGALGEAL